MCQDTDPAPGSVDSLTEKGCSVLITVLSDQELIKALVLFTVTISISYAPK